MRGTSRRFVGRLRIGTVLCARLAMISLDLLQQPLALVANAQQRPLAFHARAVQFELEVALLERCDGIADRRPRAAVPDIDTTRTVVAGRNVSRELRVFERMVFGLDRETLDRRIVARTFWHGPALEHAVQFEPEVVMQVARGVTLHDELERGVHLRALRRRRVRIDAATRFGRGAEVALGVIVAEFAIGFHSESLVSGA